MYVKIAEFVVVCIDEKHHRALRSSSFRRQQYGERRRVRNSARSS